MGNCNIVYQTIIQLIVTKFWVIVTQFWYVIAAHDYLTIIYGTILIYNKNFIETVRDYFQLRHGMKKGFWIIAFEIFYFPIMLH